MKSGKVFDGEKNIPKEMDIFSFLMMTCNFLASRKNKKSKYPRVNFVNLYTYLARKIFNITTKNVILHEKKLFRISDRYFFPLDFRKSVNILSDSGMWKDLSYRSRQNSSIKNKNRFLIEVSSPSGKCYWSFLICMPYNPKNRCKELIFEDAGYYWIERRLLFEAQNIKLIASLSYSKNKNHLSHYRF